MGKTARFVMKMVAAGLALAALICMIVGSWCDVAEALEARKARRLHAKEFADYADDELYN